MPFMLVHRKALTDTEQRVLSLLLAGDDPVLELLRRQAETIDRVNRIRLGGTSLVTGPDLLVSLQPNVRARSLSVASKARRLPGFGDLIIEVGHSTMLPVLKLHNGFLSHLDFAQHRGTVPNAVRGPLKDYGYKTCGHWEDHDCEHVPELGSHARPALGIAARYPPRPADAPRAPKWLRSVEDQVDVRGPATPAALGKLQDLARTALPPDLLAFLSWTDGVDTAEVTVLSGAEMYLLDTGKPHDRLLAVGTDVSGDVYALDLVHQTAPGEYPVLHLTHDPVGRRRAATRVRPWLTRVLRTDAT